MSRWTFFLNLRSCFPNAGSFFVVSLDGNNFNMGIVWQHYLAFFLLATRNHALSICQGLRVEIFAVCQDELMRVLVNKKILPVLDGKRAHGRLWPQEEKTCDL